MPARNRSPWTVEAAATRVFGTTGTAPTNRWLGGVVVRGGVGRSLLGAMALCVGAACTQGGPSRSQATRPKNPQRSERIEPGGHSAVACRACGAFVDGPTALTFQGSREPGAHRWLYDAAKPCIARAKREGWPLDGDLQVEVGVNEDGAPKHACGAHKSMDPRLATCLLDAFDAKVPREPRRTFATWLVPKELAAGIPAETPLPEEDECELASGSDQPDDEPRLVHLPVRSCGSAEIKTVPAAEDVLASARTRMRICYQNELGPGTEMHGRFRFNLEVGKDGGVTRVCRRVSGTLNRRAVLCMASALQELRFPTLARLSTVTGSFSFVQSKTSGRGDRSSEREALRALDSTPPPPAWPWPVLVH